MKEIICIFGIFLCFGIVIYFIGFVFYRIHKDNGQHYIKELKLGNGDTVYRVMKYRWDYDQFVKDYGCIFDAKARVAKETILEEKII